MEKREIDFHHIPVMLHEACGGLNIQKNPNGVYVDCTTGGGGHSYEILKNLSPGGRLICFDRDEDAIAAAKIRLAEFSDKITFVFDNFSNILEVLGETKVDGVLIDLGVSSYQLDNPMRGFSYMHDAPLDMRMNRNDKLNAYDVVNNYSKEKLAKILFEYGEERMANKIASLIVKERAQNPITSTNHLAQLVKNAVGVGSKDGGHPAKRTFLAIRIEVNDELKIISKTIEDATKALKIGGRISIITFHSLEDRIVKQTFASLAKSCICPPKLPICVCGVKPSLSVISKAITPTQTELEHNSRSKSAKLRIAEKI